MKVLLQFRTTYCTNLRQYSKRPKRSSAHNNAQIPSLQVSLPTSAPENCVDLQHCSRLLQITIPTCRKTCLSQIVSLKYKANPYFGFQNLGCHFDT